jgi:hypothetical protein
MFLFSRIVLLLLPAIILALAPALLIQDDTLLRLDGIRVPVTLGVMSQCPDAMLCESVFDRVLKEVMDIVDMQLTYLGQ